MNQSKPDELLDKNQQQNDIITSLIDFQSYVHISLNDLEANTKEDNVVKNCNDDIG